jgi:trehalose synthase-fused probable maltokinase
VLALVDVRLGERGERTDRYLVPFVERDGAVLEAGEGHGAWRALASAIAQERTLPAMGRDGLDPIAAPANAPVEAALVCRRSPGSDDAWGADPAGILDAAEQPLGRDQSNTSSVIGGRLLLKAYRRVQPGLNPDLEMTAFLSEEAAFPGVPRLAGWAEVVTRESGAATVAMLQQLVPDGEDVYEKTAEFLAELVAAPGTVSLEWATEVAADLGTLVAGLHAALASPPAEAVDFAPREATHDELKAWRMDAHRQLWAAVPVVAAVDPAAGAELKAESAAIAARVSRFEAVATAPFVMRIHADLHLGQLLVADDGYRVIDFEGEPLRPIEDRRRLDSPLRDVASLLRSLDHVARSARRRAERRSGGRLERPGLDVDAWIVRARQRFLASYTAGLRRAGAPFTLDLDLLDAFEVAKEAYEFVYAATVLPSWLWAPREGMRWLLEHGEPE